jgi:hypothetical protein
MSSTDKIYSIDDIPVIDDAVGLIRRRPSMYLAPGVSAENIAEALAHDALLLGARRVLIAREQDWMIVAADVDWLRVSGIYRHGLPPQEIFRRIVTFPEDGVNAMRHEILATAFATDVVSATPSERFIVSGEMSDDAAIWPLLCPDGFARGVAFRGINPGVHVGGNDI